MEELSPADAGNLTDVDFFAWPLCATLGQEGVTWLAPHIPQTVLAQVLPSYLDLADDEVLLAIVAPTAKHLPTQSCAVTTKRIYWAGDPRRDRDAPSWDDPERPAAAARADGPPPARCECLAYKDLPETIAPSGVLSRGIDLGEGRKIGLGGNHRLQKTLIAFLTRVRARVRGEEPLPALPPGVVAQALWTWPAVRAVDAQARTLQAEIRQYQARTQLAPRGVLTPLLAAACALVYVVMVVAGVSPFEPQSEAMIAWGANFGPSVAFEGQAWRLLTSLFLHFGLLHLVLNLWCLLTIGPVVERFFGHLGFAALYLLSGIGGSIASLVVHPTFVCAGASGAIFGVFGGLLGYLALRHSEVPPVILQPMRSGTLGFLGYNVFCGLTSPNIDMAAHLGGLATGFGVGLLLAGGWVNRRDRVGLLRRAGVIATLAIALRLLAGQAIGHARGRILADPARGREIQTQLNAAPDLNAFTTAIQPLIDDFNRIAAGLQRVLTHLERGDAPADVIGRNLDNLIAESDTLGRRLGALPAANDEIQAMSRQLVSARTHQRHALDLLKRFLADDNPAILDGPDGLKATLKDYSQDFDALNAMLDVYIKTHHLTRRAP